MPIRSGPLRQLCWFKKLCWFKSFTRAREYQIALGFASR
jgi:hypothetical protein